MKLGHVAATLREAWTDDTLARSTTAHPSEHLTIHVETDQPAYVVATRSSVGGIGWSPIQPVNGRTYDVTTQLDRNVRRAAEEALWQLRTAPPDCLPDTDAATYLLA